MGERASISTRRAYSRTDVRIPIRLQSADDDATVSGITVNLSRSGTLARLESPVVIGGRYLIQFLRPESFNAPGSTVCVECGAAQAPQVVPEQTLWGQVLRQGAGASVYAAAFEFESLLEVLDEEAA